ncbi:MAG: hypothetical protein AAGA85_20720 [Bacteroidota bacterium]
MIYIWILALLYPTVEPIQVSEGFEKTIVGVYQGKPLYVKNPYNKTSKQFCVSEIQVNNRRLDLNYRLSALKVSFQGTDLFTPVTVRIFHQDSLCSPEIVNERSIHFHSSYKFLVTSLTDSALYWRTEGEREIGTYAVEKLDGGVWVEQESFKSQGKFEFAEYVFYPELDIGPNKYRVKYDFGTGRYLYSREAEYEHYPDPVKFKPVTTNFKLNLSRSAFFEVYNQKSELVLSGTGTEVDVRNLRPGDYVIYFDRNQPETFRRDHRPPPR